MDPLITTFNAKRAPGYRISLFLTPTINTVTGNNNLLARMSETPKDHPGQPVNLLAQEIRNQIGHITLSIEMLDSLIENNEMKTYLDVITRSSIRINHLLNTFLLCQQMKDVEIEKSPDILD